MNLPKGEWVRSNFVRVYLIDTASPQVEVHHRDVFSLHRDKYYFGVEIGWALPDGAARPVWLSTPRPQSPPRVRAHPARRSSPPPPPVDVDLHPAPDNKDRDRSPSPRPVVYSEDDDTQPPLPASPVKAQVSTSAVSSSVARPQQPPRRDSLLLAEDDEDEAAGADDDDLLAPVPSVSVSYKLPVHPTSALISKADNSAPRGGPAKSPPAAEASKPSLKRTRHARYRI